MRPVVLVILDGWGISPETRGNAIWAAPKPNFDFIQKYFPFTTLQASGISVGLPWGEPGNSQVGHIAMGTGQIWYQPLTRIMLAIQNGSFFENSAFKKAVQYTKINNSSLHVIGLLGSGSVHAYIDHLYAVLELAKKENVERVWLHLFTDGRDSPPKEGATMIENLSQKLKSQQLGKIASIIGRFYAMDRDLHWDRIEKAYRLMTEGVGEKTANLATALKKQYSQGITDEFIEPLVFQDESGHTPGLIKDNDAIIFINFREDSARELTKAFLFGDSVGFKPKPLQNIFFVTITQYEPSFPAEVAFPPLTIRYTVSQLIAAYGKKQFKIAETEKYAHITYFFNGGKEEINPSEERKLVPSLPASRFDKAPEMKAREISTELIRAIESQEYDFLVANFANADMLGHTGNYEATVKSIEVIDEVLGKIVNTVLGVGGALIITADHGNAEQMLDLKTGEIFTEHTPNPVPFYLVMNELKKAKSSIEIMNLEQGIKGLLPDVAATVLDLLGIPVPPDMDGQSLLPLLYQQAQEG